jgi:hypothetical protein
MQTLQEENLSQEQKEAYQQALIRGSAFEELIRTQGWEYVKKYYEARVQQFANNMLLQDRVSIAQFEAERWEIIGIRKLFNMIENDIKAVEMDREKAKKK